MSSTVGSPTMHRLEAALERRVLLDVLAILVERRRADAAQLAAGQRRLEQVGGVDRALGGAGADQRVQLVDEQDDRARRTSSISLSTALSRSSNSPRYFEPGDQRAQVERDQRAVLAGSPARRRRRCAAPAPRRWRSCRRRARRSAPGCSSCGGRAPASCGGSPRRGR